MDFDRLAQLLNVGGVTVICAYVLMVHGKLLSQVRDVLRDLQESVRDLADEIRRGGGRLAVVAVLAAAAAAGGCPGTGVRAQCSRAPDGTITCGIEGHRHASGDDLSPK